MSTKITARQLAYLRRCAQNWELTEAAYLTLYRERARSFAALSQSDAGWLCELAELDQEESSPADVERSHRRREISTPIDGEASYSADTDEAREICAHLNWRHAMGPIKTRREPDRVMLAGTLLKPEEWRTLAECYPLALRDGTPVHLRGYPLQDR